MTCTFRFGPVLEAYGDLLAGAWLALQFSATAMLLDVVKHPVQKQGSSHYMPGGHLDCVLMDLPQQMGGYDNQQAIEAIRLRILFIEYWSEPSANDHFGTFRKQDECPHLRGVRTFASHRSTSCFNTELIKPDGVEA